jgi:DNA-binding CsgD family transcriptional regulator
MLAWLALTLLLLGRWSEAADVANEVLSRPSVSTISRIWALTALGRLYARQGNPKAGSVLNEAQEAAEHAANVQHLGMVRAALAEAAWLTNNLQSTVEIALAAYGLATSKQHPWITGELILCLWRTGNPVQIPEWTAKPYTLQMTGDWQGAADEWERLGCPYERARALADGDTRSQITALEIFEQLGARPEADRLRSMLLKAGEVGIPLRPRSSTRRNPFNLTNRQVEILALLTENLTNAEIAARLHISPKTVDHHVSAVLGKLNVQTRQQAADLARQQPPFTTPK